MKILFTGGGTGGHIFPIIAIVRETKKLLSKGDFQLFFIGPVDELNKSFLEKEEIKVKPILAGKIRRYFGIKSLFQNLLDILFKIPIGFIQAFFHIFVISPDLIFSKGGYGSVPGVISGWLLQVPIFLHESDIAPGLANRFLSRFSLEIFISFPNTEYFPPEKIMLIGNPIRKEILEGSKEGAKKLFTLSGEKPIVLIMGGSQGAQRINDMLLTILPEILKEFELIHIAGPKNFKEVEGGANVVLTPELKKYYHLLPFLKEKELKHAYQAVNLIVSRAGSGSIFEFAALGKPSILIPLPEAAQNHQVKNAYCYAQSGAALVLEEANLTSHFFLEKLKTLFWIPADLEDMSQKAREFSRPRAAKVIAAYIAEYLSQ